MADLLIIVPTRSRPESVAKVVEAWRDTGAFEDAAELLFVWDRDDPRAPEYIEAYDKIAWSEVHRSRFRSIPEWKPLVPKLNSAALDYARDGEHFAIGFAGDDHLPRTKGWARRYVEQLRDMGTGIVYCDDGYQHDNIPTQWAMTADIVGALGRMVPAPVDHLYCDNAIRDLGETAGCLAYLPDVLIEHMHPVAGKATTDEQYERVNGSEQYRNDRAAYRLWKRSGQLAADADVVRRLCIGKGNA
jgi:hypothetical protein